MIDNYTDLTLSLFLEVDRVLRSEADEIDKQVAIIALLSGKDESEILAMPLPDYSALAAKTDFLRHECPPASAPSRLICGGFTLIPTQDFTKITTAQYVDFQTFSKGGVDKLAELLAVLLIPEGCKYNDGYDFADVVKAVGSVPLPVALGLSAFFFGALSASIRASLTSLDFQKIPKEKREQLTKEAGRLLHLTSGAGLHA